MKVPATCRTIVSEVIAVGQIIAWSPVNVHIWSVSLSWRQTHS